MGEQLTGATEIEWWPIERLLPYANNAVHHSDSQVGQLAASIRSFGFNVPCLVNDAGELIAGHGRLKGAKKAGLERVPVIRLSHLTPDQQRAFRIADNRIAQNSEWDEEMLALEMAAIKASGVDLALTGFDRRELAEIEREMEPPTGDKATGDEPAPAVPENPVTQRGDLWVLGAHRLYCGDATRREDVATLLDGARPHLMVTDPPYGVNYDPGWREDAGISNSDRGEGIMNDHRSDWEPAWRLFGGDVAYVWHAAIYAHVVAASLLKCGFNLRSQIIWAKAQLVIGRGDYHWQHETCFYVVRDGEVGHWNGARDQVTLWRERDFPETRWQGGDKESTVWEIGPPEEDEIRTRHCTQKPLECMRRPIRNNSLPKDAVYEPFAGSGTTLIACEELDRVCYAMELDPGYCDVVVQRWERYTGKKAERVVAEQ